MGINGIRERVRAFNGDITIQSSLNEGMHIYIQIQEDGIHMMNILIIDDHPVVLDGTKTLLQDLANVQIETEQDCAPFYQEWIQIPFSCFSLISI